MPAPRPPLVRPSSAPWHALNRHANKVFWDACFNPRVADSRHPSLCYPRAKPIMHLLQQIRPRETVLVIFKHILPAISARHHIINRTRRLISLRAHHAQSSSTLCQGLLFGTEPGETPAIEIARSYFPTSISINIDAKDLCVAKHPDSVMTSSLSKRTEVGNSMEILDFMARMPTKA